MKYRKLGASGIEASAIALGTWVLGGGSVWGTETNDDESIRAIHAAVDEGINLIDTAPIYGFGRSEEVVGKAISDRKDKVVIATKAGLWWDDERGSFFVDYDGVPVYRSLRPDTIQIEIENSLKRLGVDCIDLYQTHWPAVPPDQTPISETIATLMKLKEQGKIRAIGVSNVSPEELKENIRCGEISTNQPRYSMLYREIEKEILPICRENNIAILAYSPLEQGLLTGKITMETEFKEGEWRSNWDWNPWLKPENRQKVLDMLDGWSELREKYCCSQAQLTIAWTIAQPGLTHALCGARHERQAKDNAGAGRIDLEQVDVDRMTADIDALGEPA